MAQVKTGLMVDDAIGRIKSLRAKVDEHRSNPDVITQTAALVLLADIMLLKLEVECLRHQV